MEQETIGTATAKPKPKRQRETRRKSSDTESIIGAELEYTVESDGESGNESGAESEPESSPRWWSFRDGSESREQSGNESRESIRESAEERNARDGEETERPVRSEAVVKSTETKPKRTHAKKAKGALQPEDVERLLIQTFSWVALLKQAPYWNIDDPQHEIRPWSPQAAELLNRVLADRAQQFKDSSDIMSVGIGMFMLVNMRVQADIAIRKERIKQAREQMVEEEFYGEPNPNGNKNPLIQNTGVVKPSIFGNGTGLS